MPAPAALLGPLATTAIGVLSAAAGAVALHVARWQMDSLSRQELLKTIAEFRDAVADKDRRLAELRDKAREMQEQIDDFSRRLKAEEENSDLLTRESVRRDRYVRRLQRLLREAGVTVPLPPNGGGDG